jgi:hypothetical protein
MKKILIFSLCLLSGLALSQFLPKALGAEVYPGFSAVAKFTLSVALAFIMINVGREFELDKKQWRSYSLDYYVAMMTAALPWIFVAVYYMALMPKGMFEIGMPGKKPIVESFCGSHFGRYFVCHAGSGRS